MTDIRHLWPAANTSIQSKLRVTIVVDGSACAVDGWSANMRVALHQFDNFISQSPPLAMRMACTLLAPGGLLSGLELNNIVAETAPSSEASVGAIVCAHFTRLNRPDIERQNIQSSSAADQPPSWLVMFSGGKKDDDAQWPQDIATLLTARALTVMPILVGPHDDEVFLSAFGPLKPALRLQRAGTARFFSWLAAELLRSASRPRGHRASLDIAGMEAWVQL